MIIASLYNLSCFESAIDSSHRVFFCAPISTRLVSGHTDDANAANLVQVSCQSPELKQFVLFQALSKTDVVEVVEAIDGVAQRLVVLLLDEQIVVRVVDSFDIELTGQKINRI